MIFSSRAEVVEIVPTVGKDGQRWRAYERGKVRFYINSIRVPRWLHDYLRHRSEYR